MGIEKLSHYATALAQGGNGTLYQAAPPPWVIQKRCLTAASAERTRRACARPANAKIRRGGVVI